MANSGSRVFGGGGQWLVSVFIFLCSFLYVVPVGAALPQIGNTKVPEPEAEIPAIPLHHTSWGSKDGAPSIVIGMAQTSDGWLWLATFTGLYRFDGVKFEKYTPRVGKLASPGIVTVFALPTGELWIGYRSGEAGLLKDGALRNYGAAEGLPIPSTLEHFQRDSSNRIWAISSGKLYLFRNDRWERFSAGIEDPNMVLHSIFVDSRDRLWVGTVEWAFVLEPGTKEFKKMPTKLDLSGYLTETPDGEIWSNGARNDSLQQVDSPRSLSPLGMFKPDSFSYSRHMLFDREGTRWLLRRDGVQRSYTANGQKIVQRLTPAQGLSGYIPLSVLEDKEGNIWVGTNSGLDRFRQTKLKKAALPPSYVGEGRAMAAGGEGSVWTDGFFLPNSSAIPIPVSSMPSNNVAELTCLYRDSDGIIWAGGFKGISYIDRGKFYNLGMPPDSNYYPVIAIAKEADGALWISLNGKGVFVRRNGEWTKSVQFPEAASRSAMAITATESGQLLFGYSPDRIALREKGQLRLFDKRDGLHLGSILSIHSYGSDIWVGGGSGIAHFDGKRFASMKGVGEDIFAGVSGVVTSKTGQLWLNGSEGISVIEHDEWSHAIKDPAYHVKFVRYNYLDGLVGTAPQYAPNPSAIAGTDGTLWFTTANSVVSVDPTHMRVNPLKPPVQMMGLLAEGKTYPLAEGLQLPPGTRNIQLEYTALSLSMPERVQFRYRLEGVDEKWNDAGTRRSAYYTELGPGTYRFTVQASNEDKLWNETGAFVEFRILPTITQTIWFRLLCVLLFLLLLWGLYRWRLHRVSSHIRSRLRARGDERERIARELHDTLLQGVQALILRLHVASTKAARQDSVKEILDTALNQADQMLEESREQVQDLRAHDHFETGLPGMLERDGRAMAAGTAIAFSFSESGRRQEVAATVSHEIYRIVHEALHNAFRHAQASAIEVQMSYDGQSLSIIVSDDGKGLPEDVELQGRRAGHWGLPGMRERAERLGATLAIDTAAGKGVELSLKIPARVAYVKDSTRQGGRWKFWQ